MHGNGSRVGLIVFCATQNLCDNLFLKDDIITYTILSAKGQLDGYKEETIHFSFFMHFHNRMVQKWMETILPRWSECFHN